MAKGLVKWFNSDRGYGFIQGEKVSDIFVHFSDIQTEGFKTLKEGQLVDFELTDGAKGSMARNVVPQIKSSNLNHTISI